MIYKIHKNQLSKTKRFVDSSSDLALSVLSFFLAIILIYLGATGFVKLNLSA